MSYQNLVTDESLVLFQGHIHFRKYIATKRHRFGLKTFVLCDCKTRVVLDMTVYTGKTTDIGKDSLLGVSGAVVCELMSAYMNEGQVLYLDNWYTSLKLCQCLPPA